MRLLSYLLLLTISVQAFSQDRAKVDFQKDISAVQITLDGNRVLIKSEDWHPRAYGPYVRDYVLYDLPAKSIRFFSESGPYGRLSPNGNYFSNTKLKYVNAKKATYKSSLLNLESGARKEWENEHFALVPFSDGMVLATKAKTKKSIARMESFSTLYLYNPNGGKPKQLVGKKEVLGKKSYQTITVQLDADDDFFHLVSPDNLTSWGGEIYNEAGYPTLKFYDLQTGSKQERTIRFEGDTTTLPKRWMLAVEGKYGVMRNGSRKYKDQWTDYFISVESGEKQGIANQDTQTEPAQYQMLNGKVYQFNSTGTIITRFETSSGKAISDKVWYPQIPKAMLTEDKYRFAIAADRYLFVLPAKRTGQEAQALVYDLSTDAIIDNFVLYKKDIPKAVASATPTKKPYKSDLLNSYDNLSLPYQSGYASGRNVTGLAGSGNIGAGQVFAVGKIGNTANGNLVLLSLTRYTASNGSEVSTYHVSVFDKNGVHQRSKQIGTVQRSSAGRTFAVVNFRIKRESYNNYSIIGEQQFEQRKTPLKFTIDSSGIFH